MRQINDIITDVKTFWHPFLSFSWQKGGTVHKNILLLLLLGPI